MEKDRAITGNPMVKLLIWVLVIAVIAVPLTLVVTEWRQIDAENLDGDPKGEIHALRRLAVNGDLGALADLLETGLDVLGPHLQQGPEHVFGHSGPGFVPEFTRQAL